MSITFKATPKKNPQDIEAPAKYYGTAVSNGKVGIDELASLIAEKSTVSRADTYAVIISMLEQIMTDLEAGRSVELGKLGTFSISLQSEGVEIPEELAAKHIKKAKINYRPGAELKKMLANLKYKKG